MKLRMNGAPGSGADFKKKEMAQNGIGLPALHIPRSDKDGPQQMWRDRVRCSLSPLRARVFWRSDLLRTFSRETSKRGPAREGAYGSDARQSNQPK